MRQDNLQRRVLRTSQPSGAIPAFPVARFYAGEKREVERTGRGKICTGAPRVPRGQAPARSAQLVWVAWPILIERPGRVGRVPQEEHLLAWRVRELEVAQPDETEG